MASLTRLSCWPIGSLALAVVLPDLLRSRVYLHNSIAECAQFTKTSADNAQSHNVHRRRSHRCKLQLGIDRLHKRPLV